MEDDPIKEVEHENVQGEKYEQERTNEGNGD